MQSSAKQQKSSCVPCSITKKQAQFYERLAWDKASQWGKRQQMGSNRKNSREWSELSGILGRGKGWRSLETCLWCSRSMIPDSGIMLWLVQCLHVDRFVVLMTVSRSFNIMFLQFRKRFFKTWILSKQHKKLISLQGFSLIPRLQEKQKIYLWFAAKRKRSIQNMELFLHNSMINYRHIYKATDL